MDRLDKIDYLVKRRIPMVKPSPLKTFLPRLFKKCSILFFDTFLRALSLIGHSKASRIGYTPEGNLIIRLNKDLRLGTIGSELHIPDDELFSGQICRYGEWDSLDVDFLVEGLNQKKASVFCDIGANSGLISLQIKNLCRKPTTFILVEPVPCHVKAIKHNMFQNQTKHTIKVLEVALSKTDGVGEIYIQESNRGNSSLFSEVVSQSKMQTMPVVLENSKFFAKKYLSDFENIVLKSDTQGMDATILTQFPLDLWKSVSRAVIEIWAVPMIKESEVKSLMDVWKNFSQISWSGEARSLTLDEVQTFWLSNSGLHKNLFLAR
jgi:FkbM family methyltransferase